MKAISTKFGKARLNNKGYYTITSRKEGNNGKLLHRLIFEDFYKTKIPKGYVIHHKNKNPRDNCILNLQLLKDITHKSMHSDGKHNARYGKQASKETRIKMSKTHNNSTGYFRVSKEKSNTCNQGFYWKYRYYENKKSKTLSSIDINKLRDKVIAKGLDWIVLDENKVKEVFGGISQWQSE